MQGLNRLIGNGATVPAALSERHEGLDYGKCSLVQVRQITK